MAKSIHTSLTRRLIAVADADPALKSRAKFTSPLARRIYEQVSLIYPHVSLCLLFDSRA